MLFVPYPAHRAEKFSTEAEVEYGTSISPFIVRSLGAELSDQVSVLVPVARPFASPYKTYPAVVRPVALVDFTGYSHAAEP